MFLLLFVSFLYIPGDVIFTNLLVPRALWFSSFYLRFDDISRIFAFTTCRPILSDMCSLVELFYVSFVIDDSYLG